MNFDDFTDRLGDSEPPSDLPPLVKALWHDASGNWDRAHEIAQEVGGQNGAWVHAYLHRKEGDKGNASYWYNRANRDMPDFSLEEEWKQIAGALLSEGTS